MLRNLVSGGGRESRQNGELIRLSMLLLHNCSSSSSTLRQWSLHGGLASDRYLLTFFYSDRVISHAILGNEPTTWSTKRTCKLSMNVCMHQDDGWSIELCGCWTLRGGVSAWGCLNEYLISLWILSLTIDSHVKRHSTHRRSIGCWVYTLARLS